MVNKKRIRFNDFMVHFSQSVGWIRFWVYPVVDCYSGNKEPEMNYVTDESGGQDPFLPFDIDKALCKFCGSVNYRGYWETRVYFKDDEYWGDEIQVISDLLNNDIIPWCQEEIRTIDTDIKD